MQEKTGDDEPGLSRGGKGLDVDVAVSRARSGSSQFSVVGASNALLFRFGLVHRLQQITAEIKGLPVR